MANITTQTIRVDLNTSKTIPRAFTHQGDTARTLEFAIYNNCNPFDLTGSTVKFAYKSPNVNGQYSVITGASMATGTVTGNKVAVTLPVAYTKISGVGLLTMIITPTSGTVRPVNIMLVVQKSADGDDTILNASDWPEGLYEYMDNWLEENEPTEIANLKSDLNYGLTAPSGYVLRATDNGHGNEWAMVGTPTDAQAETAINKWLDEHPEATTTVQDGSLTLPKFKDGELPFVTPEQFGAKGNGVVDDSTAFATAFASYKCVYLIPNKKYLVTQKIDISSNTIFNGNRSTIICGGDTPLNIVGDEVVVKNICFEGTQAQTQYAINIDTGAENTTIRNVYGTGLKYSLVMNDGTGSVIENCYANLCGWDCVSNYSHAKNSIISNCFAIKTGRHGFSTDEGANGITFENCYAEDIGSIVGEGHSSFHLEGASYCTIRNCKAVYTANHPKKDNMGNDIYNGFRIDSASSSMVGNVIDGLEIIYETGFSTESVADVKPLYLNSAVSNNTIQIHNLTIRNYTGQVYTSYIGVMLASLYNFIVYGNCPMLQYSSYGGFTEIKHGNVNMLNKTNIFYRAQYIANGLVVSDVYSKGCSNLIRGRLVNCILENNVIEDCDISFGLNQATGDSSAKSHGNIIRKNVFKDLSMGVQLGWWTGTEQNIICENVFTGTITTLLDGNYCGCYFYDNIQKDLTYTTAKTNVTVTTTPPSLTV